MKFNLVRCINIIYRHKFILYSDIPVVLEKKFTHRERARETERERDTGRERERERERERGRERETVF